MGARWGTPERGSAGGLVRVLAAAAAMGTLGPVAGLAYREGLEPATLSALRAVIGAGILAALLRSGRQPWVPLRGLPQRQRVLLLLAVTVNALTNLVLFLAFGAMAVGLVMVVYYAYPVLVALLSAALGRERLTAGRVLALALAIAGLALVLGSQLGPGAHATAAGLALAGAAASLHAVYLVAVRGGFDDVPGVQATALVLAGGVVVSGSVALLAHGPAVLGPWIGAPLAWVAIACAGTVGALPKVWVIGGVRRIGSTRAAVALLTEPLVAVLVAAAVLAQALGPAELLGALAILAGVVLVQRPVPPAGRGLSAEPGEAAQLGPRA